MKGSTRFLPAMSLALVFVVLAACSPVASSGMKFPTGKFVSEKDKAVGWQFNADGSSVYFFATKDPIAHGTYSIDGNTYTETSNDVGSSDARCQAPAKYNWSYEGSKLTFTVISDECKDRMEAYTGGPFVPEQ